MKLGFDLFNSCFFLSQIFSLVITCMLQIFTTLPAGLKFESHFCHFDSFCPSCHQIYTSLRVHLSFEFFPCHICGAFIVFRAMYTTGINGHNCVLNRLNLSMQYDLPLNCILILPQLCFICQ